METATPAIAAWLDRHPPSEATDAIRAVLEVHRGVPAINTTAPPGLQACKVCAGCGTDAGNWQQWPCPTVQAVGQALGAGK